MKADQPESELIKSAPIHPVVRAELESFTDREIGHLRQLVERTMAEKDVALDLQRTEYLRRLNDLNHAHELAAAAVLKTVPRETFEMFVNNYNQKHAELINDVTILKANIASNARIAAVVATLLGLAMSAIALWLNNRAPVP